MEKGAGFWCFGESTSWVELAGGISRGRESTEHGMGGKKEEI